MSTPVQDVLSAVVNAIMTTLQTFAEAIAENAGLIATVVISLGIAYMVYRYGRRFITGLVGWFRGIF